MPNQIRIMKRAYVRVPVYLKEKLLDLVFRHGYKIKDAALNLDVKYATAKTIIFYYRETHIKKTIEKGTRRCCYAFRDDTNIRVLSQIAGGSVYHNLQ